MSDLNTQNFGQRSQQLIRAGANGLAATSLAVLVSVGGAATPAQAQTNLVTNGTFAITGSSPQSFQFGTYGPYNATTALGESLAGWSSTGYNYVFIPTDTTATGYYGALSLWNPTNGAANGFTNASPTGGNYIAADSDYPGGGTAPITQTISGLTVGRIYRVSFAWAGAQQSGFDGTTTQSWQVSFGSSTQNTATINVANHGFSGWMNQTFNFVATSSSQALSFLAVGSPAIPPFTLLANVSVTVVPEPASGGPLLVGFAGLLGLAWWRRKRPASPN